MQTKRSGHFRPLDGPVFFWMLAAVAAIYPAYDRQASWTTLIALLGGGVVYLGISLSGRQRAAAVWIARAAAGLGGAAAFYFITQYGHYNTLEKVGAITALARFLAAPFPTISAWQPVANSMAALLEGLLFLALGLLLVEPHPRARWAAGISAGLMALALLLSESRGAWVGLAAAGLVWAAVHFRPARWLALAGAAGLLLLVGIVLAVGDITVLGRIPMVDRTLAPLFIRPDRLDIYRGSVQLIQDLPFTGVGLGGQFAMNYSRYVLLIQVPFLEYSHNLYLETWLQTGLAGITALVWLAAALAYTALGQLRSGASPLTEAAWVGLLAVLLHGVTDARQYSDLWCWIPFFLLLGLASAAWTRHAPHLRGAWLPAAAAGGFLAVVLLSLPSLPAAWEANLGGLAQAKAELGGAAGELGEAEEHLQRSADLLTVQRPAQLRLGLIRTWQENYAEAVSHLEAAHQAAPQNDTVIKALGLAVMWNGDAERAAGLLKETAGMTEELNTWGTWRASQGQADLARLAYRTSLLINPQQPAVETALQRLP